MSGEFMPSDIGILRESASKSATSLGHILLGWRTCVYGERHVAYCSCSVCEARCVVDTDPPEGRQRMSGRAVQEPCERE